MGPGGMVAILAAPAEGKATLPEGFVSPPEWLLAAPHEDTARKVGDLAGDLQGTSSVSSSCSPKP